ncbi:uncharacterized protein LOC122621647 isoform X2 [Drosophila teissieri]|uniref:uncharacterized protein LOC122621647 isoform X2 n=1 Tax=Drosophila teissieri TaxID=7243 RepID=UPI001CBA451F|nr:uncharacterized protein LOC122621647 isoform X2 [Drosophila teissieri]
MDRAHGNGSQNHSSVQDNLDQLVFYGSHNKHHQQQQHRRRRLQEHSTSSAAHCVLAKRPEKVSKYEPKSGVLGQRDGGGDDGRMPIMCGHKTNCKQVEPVLRFDRTCFPGFLASGLS